MSPATFLLLPLAVASALIFSLSEAIQLVWTRKSPLHRLRGPKSTNIIYGNLIQLINDYTLKCSQGNGELVKSWVKNYGTSVTYKGLLNRNHLMTIDTCAANHILTHTNDYQKSFITRRGLTEISGKGVLVAEGAEHRQQRRIMNPAFGPAQIRVLTETFLAKASHLRDSWSSEVTKDPAHETTLGTRIDVITWLNKVTLDVIGLAGFNYDFNSLGSSGHSNDGSEALSTTLSENQSISTLYLILRALIPVLRLVPTAERRKIRAASHSMTQIGEGLLSSAKAATIAESGKGGIEKNNLSGRDLLSLLVKANIANDIPDSQRLSDEDVIAQVPTFLFAGHETTSTAIAWALYSLTQAPEVQTKLREELLSVGTDTPSMDELIALPYFDAFVREVLRVHPPLTATPRIAMKDDVLPVEKPYKDRHGVMRDNIPIAKGDEIIISIVAMNYSEELWGPDAHEFRPERWNDLPEAVFRVPGVWGNMLTFIGGPRSCIGYRFALAEIKAILFTLVRAFEFELAVPASEITKRITIAQHPVLRSDPTHQAQLPLLIRPYERA